MKQTYPHRKASYLHLPFLVLGAAALLMAPEMADVVIMAGEMGLIVPYNIFGYFK